MNNYLSLCAAFLLIGAATSCRAQQMANPSPSLMRQYERATNNTIKAILKQATPLLSVEQQKTVAKIDIRVLPESWELYGLSADSESGERRSIEIPLGLIFVLDGIDSAVAAGAAAGIEQTTTNSYVSALNHTVAENMQRIKEGHRLLPLPEFPRFAGIPPQRWQQIVRSERYRGFKEVAKLSSLSFLLLHEIAHLVLPEPEASSEASADDFAIKYSLRAGYNPMFAFYSFGLHATIEEDAAIEFTNREPTLCRAVLIFLRGLAEAREDPEFVGFMQSRNQFEQLEQVPTQIQQVLEEDGVSCPSLEPYLQ